MRRWLGGLMLGTLLVAITSPLFVRSYLPRPLDSLRRVTTMQPGRTFRWRSEGWANTFIGPHGMPGRRDSPEPKRGTTRVAIWGDSQAEGVCVADHQKLHVQLERSSPAPSGSDESPRLVAFPMGRSGDDAADWLSQIPAVEDALAIDAHLVLVVELSDLAAATDPARTTETGSRMESLNARIVGLVPMFVIHASRLMLTTDGYTPRRLRFAVGPVDSEIVSDAPAEKPSGSVDWDQVLDRFLATTKRDLWIVYAPVLPNIAAGRVAWNDGHSGQFDALKRVAESKGVAVIDVREEFARSAESHRWAHGFHNGIFGAGHTNAVGYEIIAQKVAEFVASPTVDRE